MSKYIVVVADTQRARLFTLQESLTPEIESSPRLVEEQSLLNAEKVQKARKQHAAPAGGRTRSGSGGFYAFDEHRGKRDQDELRRFSALAIREALKQARKANAHTLLLVASGKTLGVMRAAMATISLNGFEIRECERELTGESPSRIQALLARRKLIPAVKRPPQRVRK